MLQIWVIPLPSLLPSLLPSSPSLAHLLAAVDDVFREGESPDGRAADDRVVSGRRVRHLHRAELQERLAQGHPTQNELSVGGGERKVLALSFLHPILTASSCLLTFGRCSRSGPCAEGTLSRLRYRICTGCSWRSARRSRYLQRSGRIIFDGNLSNKLAQLG